MLTGDILPTCVVPLGSWLAYVPESPLKVASILEAPLSQSHFIDENTEARQLPPVA